MAPVTPERVVCGARAAGGAVLLSLPAIAVWWFLVGATISGFVTGPDPTLRLFLREVAWSLPPAVVLLAELLRRRLRTACGLRLGRPDAVVAALVGLAPVQVAMGVITLRQLGHDAQVFTLGTAVGFVAMATTVALGAWRSSRRDRPDRSSRQR